MDTITDILKTMDYGPSPEDGTVVREWLARHEAGFGHFIDGAFTAGTETFEVANPATGVVIARVAQGTGADVEAAVAAARAAQPGWAALPGHERAKHLYALARHVQQHARFLAVLETLSAKMRIFRVPEFLATAFLLAVIGMLVHLLLAH